jgi:hypothetical protein
VRDNGVILRDHYLEQPQLDAVREKKVVLAM